MGQHQKSPGGIEKKPAGRGSSEHQIPKRRHRGLLQRVGECQNPAPSLPGKLAHFCGHYIVIRQRNRHQQCTPFQQGEGRLHTVVQLSVYHNGRKPHNGQTHGKKIGNLHRISCNQHPASSRPPGTAMEYPNGQTAV